jgi:FkbH-like protein
MIYRSILISDSTMDNLAGYLANDASEPAVQPFMTPYGQVAPSLLDAESDVWNPAPDFAVVWTRPEAVIPNYSRLLAGGKADLAEIDADVDTYARALAIAAPRVKALFAASWAAPSTAPDVLELRPGSGSRNVLMRMNLRLAERLADESNIYMLDAERWIRSAGTRAHVPKLWYLAKLAYGNEVYREAAREIKSAMRSVLGCTRKIVIVDLDETLWGGVVGDLGWENIRLGGHEPAGEAYADFQAALKALTRRGVLLAIASKNEETIALDTIRRHPEMRLSLDDFAAWRINWNDKAANIADLMSELRLGLDSAVFIDDNPVERARVREALPEVLVPNWPSDPVLYKSTLVSLDCFNSAALTEEDRGRAATYASERARAELRQSVGSLDAWLRKMGTRVQLAPLDDRHLKRAAQLINKTNQMNLSTRRMTEEELKRMHNDGTKVWTVHVSDVFGNYGLTGLVSMSCEGNTARIRDFVLSCRVMGRRVEQLMLSTVVQFASAKGLEEVRARYIPTEKNAPCLNVLANSGFEQVEPFEFVWRTARDYPAPDSVEIENAAFAC